VRCGGSGAVGGAGTLDREADNMRLRLRLKPVGQRIQPVDHCSIGAGQHRIALAFAQLPQPGDHLLDFDQSLVPGSRFLRIVRKLWVLPCHPSRHQSATR
jgi:hypothetical protein